MLQGTSLACLAQLECDLAAHFHAPSFTHLALPGRPPSLLAAAALDPALAALLSHGVHGPQLGSGQLAVAPVPSLAAVLSVASQALTSLGVDLMELGAPQDAAMGVEGSDQPGVWTPPFAQHQPTCDPMGAEVLSPWGLLSYAYPLFTPACYVVYAVYCTMGPARTLDIGVLCRRVARSALPAARASSVRLPVPPLWCA